MVELVVTLPTSGRSRLRVDLLGLLRGGEADIPVPVRRRGARERGAMARAGVAFGGPGVWVGRIQVRKVRVEQCAVRAVRGDHGAPRVGVADGRAVYVPN